MKDADIIIRKCCIEHCGSILYHNSRVAIIDSILVNCSFYIAFPEDIKGLRIINTTIDGKPVILIKNMNLNGRNIRELYPIAGQILLYNVSNAVITGYEFSRTGMGIGLYDVSNIEIKDCTYVECGYGIYIVGGHNVNIVNCMFMDCREGVVLYARDEDTVIENVKLENLYFKNGGLVISGINGNYFRNLKVINCFVNGKPLVYLSDIDFEGRDLKELFPRAGQIILLNVSNAIVEGYELDNTTIAIELLWCRGVKVKNCEIKDCSTGIQAYSSYIEVNECTISGCEQGIFAHTSNLSIIGCILENLQGCYIFLVRSNASIYLCSFLGLPNRDNTYILAFLNSKVNLNNPKEIVYEYNGKVFRSILGNYWEAFSSKCIDADNDGICDLSYRFRGPMGVELEDRKPLVKPSWNYKIKSGLAITTSKTPTSYTLSPTSSSRPSPTPTASTIASLQLIKGVLTLSLAFIIIIIVLVIAFLLRRKAKHTS